MCKSGVQNRSLDLLDMFGSHQNMVIFKCVEINEIIWECRKILKSQNQVLRFCRGRGVATGQLRCCRVGRKSGKGIQETREESGRYRSFRC